MEALYRRTRCTCQGTALLRQAAQGEHAVVLAFVAERAFLVVTAAEVEVLDDGSRTKCQRVAAVHTGRVGAAAIVDIEPAFPVAGAAIATEASSQVPALL